jgi:hypothetical protein
MSVTGKSIEKHPARNEINERLLAGESVEAVSAWLRQKYSRDPSMHLNKMTLQAYRRNYLNIDGDVLAEIKKARRVKIEEDKKRRAVEAVHASQDYQIAVAKGAEIAVRQIEDTGTRLEEMFMKINERIKIIETQKISHLNDKVIAEYLRLTKDLMKDWFEMQQELKEDNQTNIDIDVRRVMVELKILKAAMREAITDVCPEAWPTVLEKLKEKLESARLMADTTSDDLADTPININIRA